jgi:hypothetical protein
LEVGIVKLMELRGVETIAEILRRLTSLESGSGGSAPTPARSEPSKRSAQAVAASTASSLAVPTDAPGTASFSATPGGASHGGSHVSAPPVSGTLTGAATAPASVAVTTADVSPVDQIKSALERQRKMLLVTALDHALNTTLENGELFIEFAPESRHFRDTLSKPENVKFVRDACREVTGQETGLRIAVKNAQAEGEPLSAEEEARLEKQRLREMAESSPVVQQMLKTFRGEIVDVRHPEAKD